MAVKRFFRTPGQQAFKGVRVYEEVEGRPDLVREIPKIVTDQTGTMVDYPIRKATAIPRNQVPAACPVIPSQQQNQKISTMQNQNNVWGLVPQETVTGEKGVARMETPDINGVRVTVRIGISNGELTAEQFALGDHHGLIADAFSIVAPKGGVTITGSWGANSYTFLKQITGANPYRLHGLHMQCTTTAGAASTSFYNNGFLKAVRATENGDSPHEVTIPISDLVEPDTFQTNIRKVADFRMLMDGFAALYCEIPAGIAVTFTFTFLRSVNKTYAMDLINR